MKNKLWIESRVFLSFSIFIILIVNIFAFLLYFFVTENIKTNTNNWIKNEFETIKTFIDLQKSNIFSLPKYEIEKINNLWFYFYIWNNDEELKQRYKLGFSDNEFNTIYRWDYKWYNIVIWKNTKEYQNFKKSFSDMLFLLNLFLIITIFLLSYFITKISLTPLLNLSNFLNNYKNNPNQKVIKNNYWNSEIWILTKSVNKFIKENNNILELQTNFIQDVSHELKTPLMQIDSNIELIEEKILDEKIKSKINSIKDSVSNINEIITNLWFILRWEEIAKNKEQINLLEYLSNFIKKFENQSKNKNIKIIIEEKYNLSILNNTYYLDRLFWNIISNSIFYNEWNNEIKIIIDKNNIIIEDKWIWINKEEIGKIFTRFYRNKNSWLYYKNWNWLWLVIVKKICDMFWWKIDIDSELKKWTKISIFL